MIVMIMNFFVAILNDFLSAVANSKAMQNHDFEVMDHFIDTVKELIVTNTDNNGTVSQRRRPLKSRQAGRCNFPTDAETFPTEFRQPAANSRQWKL